MEDSSNARADWLSIAMHSIIGMLMGCGVGFLVITRRRHGIWLAEPLVVPFLVGAAMIGGGVAALRGDALWLESAFRVIPPDRPRHSRGSIRMCRGVIAGGGLLAAASLLRHFC